MSLPLYQKNGTQTKQSIIQSYKNEQLLTGLQNLISGKTYFYAWKDFPSIPYTQERYFWNVLQAAHKAQRMGARVFTLRPGLSILYRPDLCPDCRLLYWAFLHSNEWIPEAIQRDDPLVGKLLRALAQLERVKISPAQTKNFLLRTYLRWKAQIKGFAVPESPYAIRAWLDFEDELHTIYQNLHQKDPQMTEFQEALQRARQEWPLLRQELPKQKAWKTWKKTHPEKKYQLRVKEVFPKDAAQYQPFTVAMFEEKVQQLNKQKTKPKK